MTSPDYLGWSVSAALDGSAALAGEMFNLFAIYQEKGVLQSPFQVFSKLVLGFGSSFWVIGSSGPTEPSGSCVFLRDRFTTRKSSTLPSNSSSYQKENPPGKLTLILSH